jgi:hypothetical protein
LVLVGFMGVGMRGEGEIWQVPENLNFFRQIQFSPVTNF